MRHYKVKQCFTFFYAKLWLSHCFENTMLEFWFNPEISIAKKIILLVLLAAVTVGLYLYQPLTLDNILLFAGTGIIFLICRYCKIHFAAKNPTGLLFRLLTWIPLALVLALIFKNMNNGEILIPGAQGIGFMALAVCIFSPFSLLHKNTSNVVSK